MKKTLYKISRKRKLTLVKVVIILNLDPISEEVIEEQNWVPYYKIDVRVRRVCQILSRLYLKTFGDELGLWWTWFLSVLTSKSPKKRDFKIVYEIKTFSNEV